MPWLLATKRFLYRMSPGGDTWDKRWPMEVLKSGALRSNLQQTWFAPWPGSIVFDFEREQEPDYFGDTATNGGGSTAPTQPISLSPPPSGPAIPTPAPPPPFLRMKRSGSMQGRLMIFTLEAVLGGRVAATWQVFSGAPSAQTIDQPETDWVGSNRPIPHGLYLVGPVEQARGASWGPGLGPLWVSLDPVYPRNKRNSIGIHQDENASTSPGSAGCVVHPDLARIRQMCDWITKHKPRYLLVDYGFDLGREKQLIGG